MLTSQGALLSQAYVEGGFFPLPPRLLIRLTGSDRLRYLNGQVTNDLKKMVPGTAMQACLLTPKGKLSAILWITLEEESLLVEAPLELAEELPARLERYIVADDVALQVISSSSTFHFFGALSNHPEVVKASGVAIDRLGISGKDIPAHSASTLSLLAEKEPLSAELMEVIRLHYGIPRWNFELTEERLPSEAHLEKNCIDYEKGCYLGQEVVSRLKSLGHVNRLLTGLSSAGSVALTQGMKLFSPNNLEKALGFVTSGAWCYDAQKFIGLGYLHRDHDTPGLSLLAIDETSGEKTEVMVRAL